MYRVKYLLNLSIRFHSTLTPKFNPWYDYRAYLDQVKTYINRLNPYIELDLRSAALNWDYILNNENLQTIANNIKQRKENESVDIEHILTLHRDIQNLFHRIEDKKLDSIQGEDQIKLKIQDLYNHAIRIPNNTHPDIPIGNQEQARTLRVVGKKPETNIPRQTIDQIGQELNLMQLENMGHVSFRGAYALFGDFARLERALMYYAFEKLTQNGFKMVSVPDIIHRGIIESCGFATRGKRSQVYQLDYGEEFGRYCLAGTAEMPLAGLLKHNTFRKDELPLKLAACSRCYRAELPGGKGEGNLYRVHEFTKVEMFAVTTNDEKVSQEMHDEIVRIETSMYEDLGLHFRILDMPTEELGLSAYRKYDIETWMPAKEFYGEISSASNCTDFQSRRLHIKYINDNGDEQFVHTLNGTAMAIPRMLTAIIELNWNPETKQIQIPKPLRSLMGNREFISKSSSTPSTQWIKFLS
ncbi:unnamed protein product [Rotaria sordida]|uniref:serine--tRNA ligase n=1 Tax=Rotaria sordida TaxID=392033 RepID=A0A814A0R2_9BILA|nr:unnamed protein product [Rotaria sordida]CAF0886211.1 unnamed protein product [Rotaria sordida]CAF0898171.1 unnamed protein product [Rotaria sordida]CAF0905955.1 unnamed protein product [Rotaria sordida]CAF1241437.1 unnamed protein product [Rotaria sordida]